MLCPCARHVMLYIVLLQLKKRSDMTGMLIFNSNNRSPQLLSASVLEL